MNHVDQGRRSIGDGTQYHQHRDRLHRQPQRGDDKNFTEECAARYAADDNGGEHGDQHGQEEGLGGEFHPQHRIDKNNLQCGDHGHAALIQVNQQRNRDIDDFRVNAHRFTGAQGDGQRP